MLSSLTLRFHGDHLDLGIKTNLWDWPQVEDRLSSLKPKLLVARA